MKKKKNRKNQGHEQRKPGSRDMKEKDRRTKHKKTKKEQIQGERKTKNN